MAIEDFDTEAEIFEESRTARRALDELSHTVAEVIIDLQDKGPLRSYVVDKREEAIEAMRALARINPTHTAEIIELQATIRLFADVCEWIHRKLDEGDQIVEQINQESASGPTYTD